MYFSAFIKILIFISLATKLFLAGDGFLAFPDENRYFASEEAITSVKQKDFNGVVKAIFSTQGRPGEVLTKTIPMYIQILSHRVLHIYKFAPENTFPLFLFNFIIYILILSLIYRLGLFTLNSPIYALILVLLYSLCTNSYLYLRHALPYDTSLLIFLFVIYKIVRTNPNFYIIGFLAFFGYLTYPGYIFLFGFSAALVLIYRIDTFNNINYIKSVKFFVGATVCLLIFEGLSSIADLSYLKIAYNISDKITQGDFNESFTFLVKYLVEVEQLTGLFMLTIILLSLYFIPRFEKQITSFITLSLLFLILGYTTWATLGYFFHKVVFYGRLIHMYLPFLCFISIYVIYKIETEFKLDFKVLTCLLFTGQYIFTFYTYQKIAYPRDSVFRLSTKFQIQSFSNVNTIGNNTRVPNRFDKENSINFNSTKNSNAIIVNCVFFDDVNDITNQEDFAGYKKVYDESHFLSFKAYQYEGWGINSRSILEKFKPSISLYLKQ